MPQLRSAALATERALEQCTRFTCGRAPRVPYTNVQVSWSFRGRLMPQRWRGQRFEVTKERARENSDGADVTRRPR